MGRKKFLAVMMVYGMLLGLTGCGNAGDSAETDSPEDAWQEETVEWESLPEQTETRETETQEAETWETETQETQDGEDAGLDEKLSAYRIAREDWTAIPMGNGVTGSGGKMQNPEEFGFTFDASSIGNFDSRELTEAYDTAKKYVEESLKVSVTTKHTVYMCVDPRIWAIYDAEDKGVADGYAPENIFICEYCDNGNWQYLILVREEKGKAWSVIHHGDSYMADDDSE